MRAIVTGATSGIGSVLADRLEERGFELLRVGSDFCDLRGDRTPLVDEIRKVPPDLLINCAGFNLFGNAADYSVQEQLDIAQVNAMAVAELTLEMVHALIDAGREGTIVNVSSLLADLPAPGAALYSASKGFVNKMTESLNYELRPHGIRLYSCALGQVETPFFQRALGREIEYDSGAISPDEAADWILNCIGSKRALHRIGGRHGWLTRFARLLPTSLVNKLVHAILSQR